MKKHLLLALAASAALTLQADVRSFDFQDAKGVNNVKFDLDAPLEAISGQSTGISGTVLFDPKNPVVTSGKISIATASLVVGNPKMVEHMLSNGWLDASQFPAITFEATALQNVQTNGNVTKAEAVGTFTLKGISKPMTIPVTLTYLEGKLGTRLNKPEMKGDLLVIRSTFSINRSDFGIKAGEYTEKVAESIHLSLAIAGASAQ